MISTKLDTDVLIVGAGIIGLTIARELSLAGFNTITIERNKTVGSETSARSSEVVHAGLYYRPGSRKAHHCVNGNKQLYSYCDDRKITYNRCGKLVVATNHDECQALYQLLKTAEANGVNDLIMLTKTKAKNLEPELNCKEALLSPSTGIFDSHQFIHAISTDLQNTGGILALNSTLTAVYPENYGLKTKVEGHNESVDILSSWLINAAGLESQGVARCIQGFDRRYVPLQHLAKGTYFTTTQRPPFSRLVYPVPYEKGLGIHFTFDLGGQAKFGPDIEWVDKIDYATDPNRKKKFLEAILSYWPNIDVDALHPGYAGIRPKIAGPNEPSADFLIQGPDVHGINGIINLFGIESPGLTASISLASEVVSLMTEQPI